jgi:hypothetical protein
MMPAMNFNKKNLRNTNAQTNKLMLLNSPHELTLKRRARGCQDSTSLVLALVVVDVVVSLFSVSVCVCDPTRPFSFAKKKKMIGRRKRLEHTRESTLRLLLTSLRCGCAL